MKDPSKRRAVKKARSNFLSAEQAFHAWMFKHAPGGLNMDKRLLGRDAVLPFLEDLVFMDFRDK